MTKVTVDEAVRARLGNLEEAFELCDESGRTLGYFTPAVDRSLYESLKPPVTEEELQRREQQGGGRTLSEILADLEKT